MAMEIDIFLGNRLRRGLGRIGRAGTVRAGFPSPAADHMEQALSLDAELVNTPGATFFARVSGNSMVDAGINDGDVLVIDRSLPPTDGKIAVCFVDAGFTVKRIRIRGRKVQLVPANADHPVLDVEEEDGFSVWGMVTYIIHRC